jgi:hypothetical protein
VVHVTTKKKHFTIPQDSRMSKPNNPLDVETKTINSVFLSEKFDNVIVKLKTETCTSPDVERRLQ